MEDDHVFPNGKSSKLILKKPPGTGGMVTTHPPVDVAQPVGLDDGDAAAQLGQAFLHLVLHRRWEAFRTRELEPTVDCACVCV